MDENGDGGGDRVVATLGETWCSQSEQQEEISCTGHVDGPAADSFTGLKTALLRTSGTVLL